MMPELGVAGAPVMPPSVSEPGVGDVVVGAMVGKAVSPSSVGVRVGSAVGEPVGDADGELVGSGVMTREQLAIKLPLFGMSE